MFDAKKLLDLLVQGGATTPEQAQKLEGIVGQVGSMASSVFGQATSGTKQAAGEIDAATGISGKAGDLLGQLTGGQSAGDLLGKAKQMMGENKLGAGAVIGGLAAVLLGTGGGRAVIGSAARMGGLALIGGLAYKALQNYQAGKPLIDLQNAANDVSGSTPQLTQGDDNARALRLVRAMIAAAAADGTVDDAERAAITGNLKAAGLDDEAASFLDAEFANPADLSTLNEGVETPQQAAEVYTAARLAIDPDTQEEKDFLTALAGQLGLEADLVSHIEAAAASAKASA